MLTTIILYLAALLVSAATADNIPLSVVRSFTEKDCKGSMFEATFINSVKASKGHCWEITPGQSFSNLQVRDKSCKRAYVTAFASDNCKDNKGSYLFSMNVMDTADACINVDRRYGSFRLGCDNENVLSGAIGFTD